MWRSRAASRRRRRSWSCWRPRPSAWRPDALLALGRDDPVEQFLAVGPAQPDQLAGAENVAVEGPDRVVLAARALQRPALVDADHFELPRLGAGALAPGQPGRRRGMVGVEVDLPLAGEAQAHDEPVLQVALRLTGALR